MGMKSQIFEQIYTGQMTVRDSRKFVQKFVRQKIAKFGKFARRICSEQIFEQKKIIIWAIFRQAIEGSKFDEKFVKFPPHRPKCYGYHCVPKTESGAQILKIWKKIRMVDTMNEGMGRYGYSI